MQRSLRHRGHQKSGHASCEKKSNHRGRRGHREMRENSHKLGASHRLARTIRWLFGFQFLCWIYSGRRGGRPSPPGPLSHKGRGGARNGGRRGIFVVRWRPAQVTSCIPCFLGVLWLRESFARHCWYCRGRRSSSKLVMRMPSPCTLLPPRTPRFIEGKEEGRATWRIAPAVQCFCGVCFA